jgi:hypothetical protein
MHDDVSCGEQLENAGPGGMTSRATQMVMPRPWADARQLKHWGARNHPGGRPPPRSKTGGPRV